MIELKNIRFRRENRLILEDVHLSVKPGEHWVILGRNGSGKTTLLEMINGYLFPTSGTVTVLGNLYGTVDLREVRTRIGYISQSMIEKLTLRDPVWEVVATGEYGYHRFYQEVPKDVADKAREQLDRLGVGYLADQPLGTISQGERKKVLLARTLMVEPDILILDEPCSGLDLYEREKFLESVNGLGSGRMTLVYVTHHMEEIIPVFTHIALLENGRIVATGPKRDVLTEDNLMRAYSVPVDIDWEHDRPWIKVKRA